jgi:sodium-dependent phosphate cotransporter
LQPDNWDVDGNPHDIPTQPSSFDPEHSAEILPGEQRAEIDAVPSKESQRAWWKSINLSKVFLFLASLYLFILAITLMKDGAGSVAPLVQNLFSIDNPANSMGFGWLSAYLIMSGSPVAATALTFFNTGVIDELSTYAMITGSRLGAGFIVLFIGLIYVLRGRNRATSLSMGLLSLTVTATTYLPSFFLGAYFLRISLFDRLHVQTGALFESFVNNVIYPISNLVTENLPEWVVFIIGLGVVMLSFSLFDRCLPQMTLKESQLGRVSRLVYHPLVMFFLGAAITLISMSVTLSLSILVPLSNRGFVRRENVIPYIMGANITTFIDTLFAAALLDNSSSFTIVLVGMFSIAVISIAILLIAYRSYLHVSLNFVDWATSNNRNMVIFMVIIFIIPLILIVLA